MKELKLIKKNYHYSEKLKEEFLSEDRIEKKLYLAKVYGRFCVENRTGKFSDYELEEELIKISPVTVCKSQKENGRVLHIATEVYLSGGHTRLIDNWIKFEEKNQDLILLEQVEKIPIWLKETLEKSKGHIFISDLKENLLTKAQKLYNLAQGYSKIILHIHPNDIIPILAFGKDKELIKKIYFMNHADHVFWYGITISSCILDLSSEGQKLTLEKRGVKNSKILPIPLDITFTEKNVEKKRKEKYMLSMASPYKFEIERKGYNFFYFLNRLEPILEKNNIYYFLIGPSKETKIWKKIYERSNYRIIPLGILQKEEVKKIWRKIDLYIDSFPFNSYTCVLEAIANRVNSFSLKTPIVDLDILREIKVNSIDELLKKIDNYFESSNEPKILEDRIILDLENNHLKNGWKQRLEKIYITTSMDEINYKKEINVFFDEYEEFMFSKTKLKKIKYYLIKKQKIWENLKFLKNSLIKLKILVK